MAEQLIVATDVVVAEAEYHRLLGYPRGHEPSARAQELAMWARDWYSKNGRPWIYLRDASLGFGGDWLRFDEVDFHSPQLRDHLQQAQAHRAVFLIVSAGASCEEHARKLWQDSKPDEYFFLEMFGAAVVEQLVAIANGRVCGDAEAAGFSAVPHYSPGYNGWDVAEQHALFELIRRGASAAFPEAVDVMHSGMLRPKKSLLGIIGLAPQTPGARRASTSVPCVRCSFAPCQYRRASYQHTADGANGTTAHIDEGVVLHHTATAAARSAAVVLTQNARYSINPRALQKWSRERVQIEERDDATTVARFQFDGTTCSNMGRSLSFEYRIVLDAPQTGYRVLRAECRPCEGDDGYRFMCEYLRDPEGLMSAIATETPLVGRPLDDVLQWHRETASAGCYCDAASRAHKWGLALEAIHFTLAQNAATAAAVPTVS